MKNFLHKFGIHDWIYQEPKDMKIKERIVDRVDIFTQIDTGKKWSGYASFQQRDCSVCRKCELNRIDR